MGALSSLPMTITRHSLLLASCPSSVGNICCILLVLLVFAVSGTGCQIPAPEDTARTADRPGDAGSSGAMARDTTITDALGREVTLNIPVMGLAPLAPSVTEMIALVSGTGAMVGATDADTWPPGADHLPRYQVLPVDFEKLAELEPDLVLASTQVNSPRDARALEALGIPVVFLGGSDLDDVLLGLQLIGDVTGRKHRARVVVDSLLQRLHELTDLTQGVDVRPQAVFLISTGTPWSFGPESYMHDVMAWAGLESITRSFPNEAPVLSDEFILERAPEVIVGPFDTDTDARQALLEAHPLWRNVPAVRDDRIVRVPADLVLRPGPRMIEGAWIMARRAHPQLFRETP